jgi:ketopantoate reductase
MGEYQTSMQIDRRLGRPMELDAIFGLPLELGRAAGVSSPYTVTLLDQLKAIEALAVTPD